MQYKEIILTFMLVFGLSGCIETSPDMKSYKSMSLKKINTTMQNDFPERQETNFGVLLIEKPDIFSTEQKNKVRVVSSFTLSNILIPQGVKGEIFFSSGVRYNPQDRGVYLIDPIVEEMKMQDFELAEYLNEDVQKVSKEIISQVLIEKPIYKIEQAGISFVKDIAIENENLIFHLGF